MNRPILLPIQLLTLITLVFWFKSSAQDVNLEWAASLGGHEQDRGRAIAVDDAGSVSTVGLFFGTVDFDPGAGEFNLTTVGDEDVFIQKLNAFGQLEWAVQLGGLEFASSQAIEIDRYGDILISGSFRGTADFDPGPETFNLSALGWDDIFILKLNANGEFVWVKQIAGDHIDQSFSITTDTLGNIYTAGSFQGNSDFDPGAGTHTLHAFGNIDAFIQKLDSAGNFIWVRQFTGMGLQRIFSTKVDDSGNIYSTGFFSGESDFDPGSEIYNLNSAVTNCFVLKLDETGAFKWCNHLATENYSAGFSLDLDASNNLYITGDFSGDGDFDPGTGVFNLTGPGRSGVFVQKLNSGGEFIWANHIGGAEFDTAGSLVVDDQGNIIVVGTFSEKADFHSGDGQFVLSSKGESDGFIQKLDSSGEVIWLENIGGKRDDGAYYVTVDKAGGIYATGIFQKELVIDIGNCSEELNSQGDFDTFIIKLNELDSSLSDGNAKTLTLYPNPVRDILHIEKEIPLLIEIYITDSSGKMILSEALVDELSNIKVSGLPSGVYYIKASSCSKTTGYAFFKL